MSKRPLFPPPRPAHGYGCLDYEAWRAQRSHENVEHRVYGGVYDPGSENLPYRPWYTLDHNRIGQVITDMCNKLGRPLSICTIVDQEISDLWMALEHAKLLPRPKRINIAVVGNQGLGKSSTINALLSRNLVEIMGGSEACTAFATIIDYKDGAPDDTTVSDVKVTLLNLDEIRDLIEEHIRRYANLHAHATFDEEHGDTGSEDSDVSVNGPLSGKNRKFSNELQQGADTAVDFFRIMFNADADDNAGLMVDEWLKEPDLEDGRFLGCLTKLATDHISRIQEEEQGTLVYTGISDERLMEARSRAVGIWPLVKSVTISTGSVLLRHGICLLDLPGYGDLNQSRTAVVNQFRRMANFEIVVANSDRYLTKTDEDRYLTRAIRNQGAENVFLVLNKIDSYLQMPVDEIKCKLRKKEFKMDPFLSIDRYLSTNPSNADSATVTQYHRYLVREAQMAFSQHDCSRIKQKLHQKNVRVFPISASRYREWLDPHRLQEPAFKPEETGIPLLRQVLLILPAAANYDDLSNHVFETFADINGKVSRILEKFQDDYCVTAIRHQLLNVMPEMRRRLRETAFTTSKELISNAWGHSERYLIANDMVTLIDSYRQDIKTQTFWLMLRNNGFAIGGKYADKNLNLMFLEVFKSHIKEWKNRTMPKAKEFWNALDALTQVPQRMIQRLLNEAPGDPLLREKANEELEKLIRRIALAQNRLLSRLEGAVHENYRHFTTEDDIKCPIAVQLKSAYSRIKDIRKNERPRTGVVAQQRTELMRTINTDNNGHAALIDTIPYQVKNRQCEKWQAISEDFTTDVLARLHVFARIMQDLLENEVYMSDEHKSIRKQLFNQLPDFTKSFHEVSRMFPGAKAQHVSKRARRFPTAYSTFVGRATGLGPSQIKRDTN